MKVEEAAAAHRGPGETSEIQGEKWSISLPRTRIHTLEQLVEYFEIDTSEWEVERFVANKWEVAASHKGVLKVEPLFQVKAHLKKRQDVIDARRELEDLKAQFKKSAPALKAVKKPAVTTGNMLEINIPDAHFGKMAWGVETGGPNYDTKLADEIFAEAFEALLQRTASLRYDEILFVVGNDIMQSDNPEGQTYQGTAVSCDGRYHKTFRTVRSRIIDCIERLRTLTKKVKVVMVQGNHDKLSVWHLGDSLECYFHKCSDVEVDNSPRYRKYHRFGQVMLMFTHGDKGRAANLPLLMATEQREMFGATKYREIHTGHRHAVKLNEQCGIRVRILPALCPADAWHAENGLVGNIRSAEAYMWNRDEGMIGMAVFNAREQ